MDSLKNNTFSINIIILLISILCVFILYIVKDYNQSQDSIDLSNQIFKKYKGNKDGYIHKPEDITGEEIENENIMKEDFFIKKKNKENDRIYINKLSKRKEDIIYDLKKITKKENNSDNITKCEKKKNIVKEIESIDINSYLLNHSKNESEFVLESNYFEKEDEERNINKTSNLSENIDSDIDNKLLDLNKQVSKLRDLSIN